MNDKTPMTKTACLLTMAVLFVLLFSPGLSRGDILRPRRAVPREGTTLEAEELIEEEAGAAEGTPIAEEEEVAIEEIEPSLLIWTKGQTLEEAEEWADAADEYEELADDYPADPLAPRAVFRLAVCQKEMGEFYEAFLTCRRLLEDYPGKGELGEILALQFEAGEAFLNGRKRDILFFPIRSGLGTAEEIFRSIVETATFSRIAPRAQYNLGLVLQKQGDYEEAELEYDLVLKNYPGSEVIGPTFFQLGVCASERARQSDYDPKALDWAIRRFKSFIRRYPDDPLLPRAEEHLRELIDRRATKAYEIAKFYESKDSPAGARIYYQEIVERYPESRWVEEAREKLKSLPETTKE